MLEKHIIATTLSINDSECLEEQVIHAEHSGIDGWHIDICDPPFCSTEAGRPSFIDVFCKYVTKPIDAHIMSHAGDINVIWTTEMGIKTVTPHIEATGLGVDTLLGLRDRGVSPGLALRLDTPVSKLESLGLGLLDRVLLLSGSVGIPGQGFDQSVLKKIAKLKHLRDQENPDLRIGVDGGIYPETAALCAKAGADDFCCGSWIFHGSQGAKENQGGAIGYRVSQMREAIKT